jgi:hypothetical protein
MKIHIKETAVSIRIFLYSGFFKNFVKPTLTVSSGFACTSDSFISPLFCLFFILKAVYRKNKVNKTPISLSGEKRTSFDKNSLDKNIDKSTSENDTNQKPQQIIATVAINIISVFFIKKRIMGEIIISY